MRRPTAYSTVLTSFSAALAGAIALAAVVSCDTYTTSVAPTPDSTVRVSVTLLGDEYTAAQKDSMAAAAAGEASPSRMVPIGPVGSVITVPGSAVASLAACGGGTPGSAGYTESRVAFTPEDIPNHAAALPPTSAVDDKYIPDSDMPLGFNFNFHGQIYDRVNVYMNGFLLFGTRPGSAGFPDALMIPSTAAPNNIIAFGWTDWSPQFVADGIRWETRGTEPNRKFILQFTNVPEFANANRFGAILPTVGRVTAQVVLSEGSNDITIYTNELSTTNSSHKITQGIENAGGTVANYDTFFNTVLNMDLPRVKNFFKLQNDAIRFTPISTKDEVAPTFTAQPVNLEHFNDPGLATAVVAVAPPSATDNCSAVTITGVRSDGVPSLDAPYPVGVTTITWTAKDADGNTSTATQTVTVIDNENPVWGPLAEAVREVNATSPSGAVVTFDYLVVTDNVGVTSRSCEPASGSVFPLGTTPVTCTARDAAGNSSSQSLSVIVISAHEQIGHLIEYVTALDLPDGTAEPVVNQLRTAYDQTADGSSACKKVSDYLSMLQKKGSNIPRDQISYLTAEGTRIMAAMGCPPVSRSSLFTRGAFGRIP